jgi:hypothetical protein
VEGVVLGFQWVVVDSALACAHPLASFVLYTYLLPRQPSRYITNKIAGTANLQSVMADGDSVKVKTDSDNDVFRYTSQPLALASYLRTASTLSSKEILRAVV